MKLFSDLDIDSILQVREDLGVQIYDSYFLTRTWTGSRRSRDNVVDTIEKISPAPRIQDFSQRLDLVEGGVVQQGDIILKQISVKKYPSQAFIERKNEENFTLRDNGKEIELFYYVNNVVYTLVGITRKLLWWN